MIFELLWRRKYAALAASGIALVTAVVVENVSVLDPSLRAVPLVLRVNRWIVGHVLTIVTSYAAFALALGFGLLAAGYYLTATYRRPPSYRKLALPLVPGIPIYILGRQGIDSLYRLLPFQAVDPRIFDDVSSGLAVIGGMLLIVGGFSALGELANRSPWRGCMIGLVLAAVGSALSIAGATGVVPGHLAPALNSYDVWFVGLSGGALTVMSLLGLRAVDSATRIEILANLIYRAMQIGVLLLVAGTLAGGLWASSTWGRYWSWDPKEVCVLITLFVYLLPLVGRRTGWLNTFGLVVASVVCFSSVVVSWYGLNFAVHVGLHRYGFTEGGDSRIVLASALGLLAFVGAAARRRSISH